MKKTLFLMVFVVLLSSAYADDVSFGGNIGMEEIGGTLYYSVALTPELRFGKLGMGLDMYFRWNDDGIYPYSGDDVLSMIRYISWSNKGDKFFARFGVLDDSFLGHNFLLHHYQNATSFTIDNGLRRLGAQLDIDFKYIGFESITNNVTTLKIRGGRVYVRPIAPFVKKGILSGFAIGGTYLEDTDPYEAQRAIITERKGEEDQLSRYEQYAEIYENNGVTLTDQMKQDLFDISLENDENTRWGYFKNYSLTGSTDATGSIEYLSKELFDETNDPDKKLSAYSIDAELPIIKNLLVLITDFAREESYYYDVVNTTTITIKRFTTDVGQLYGVKGKLNLGLLNLAYQVDYRNIPENFIPAVFNSQYEFIKPILLPKIDDPKRISGYFGDLNIFVLNNALRINVGYEDYNDLPPELEKIYPRIKGEAELNPNLTKNMIGYGIGGKITLEKLDAEKPDFNEVTNTTIKGNLIIDIAKNTQIIYEYFRSWDSFGAEVKKVKLYSQIKF